MPGILKGLRTRYILPNEERTKSKLSFGIPKNFFTLTQQKLFFGKCEEADFDVGKKKNPGKNPL